MHIKWNHKIALLVVAIIAMSTFAVSAQQRVWSANTESRMSIITDKAVERQSFPIEFKLFDLNIDPLRDQLFSIVGNDARQRSTVISLPNAAGNMEYFEVFEASNFDPELQARFPEIRAYSGVGLTDRYATLKLSISPQGIQTMVFRTDTDNEFMEPYSRDHNTYAVYATHRDRGSLPWSCSTEDRNMVSDTTSQIRDKNLLPESSTGEIRTMRLAQSCNGEYSNFFNAFDASMVANVLAAFNATLTRANGTYERDLAIHLNLIANTTAVIYYNPSTDPYGTSISGWNAALQTTLTNNIGEANYDIGHMFGASGGGGNAGCIGCVCVDGQKGRGITSPADGIPMGDNFDIDYVVHEVGHQFGANHSFSFSNEGTGVNKEVGSGITIMGYAGITSQDVAPHSIDTFHEANIAQVQANMANKTCPILTVMTANHAPVVASVSNYTIPISTPFALTGSATDPENDALTYQWEQNDNTTTTGNSSVASPTKATGPNWLSFNPTASPTRTFPRLSTILSGLFVTPTLPGGDAVANIEALSSVSRTLNFRLTVRDNRPYVAGSTIGQTQFTDMVVTVTNSSGPFKVTAPNTAVTWAGNSAQNVTWDVNGTTGAPVSTANVKISFSSDGGQTFPTVLLASTPNDGSQSITVPNVATTQGRIKVESVGNIFFDIGDTNFTVNPTVVVSRKRADFDGDGKTDLSVFRPSTGTWFLQQSTAGFGGMNFGISSDIPVPGDYDNDSKTDIAVYRAAANSVFYVFQSSNSTVVITSFGSSTTGDIPVVGDYDGDSKADYALFRPTNGTWNVMKSTGGTVSAPFGQNGDVPVFGDFDGDGKSDYSVYRNGTWYIMQSSNGQPVITGWGLAGDLPVSADFDGDSKDDIAVWRPSNGAWYIVNSGGGVTFSVFGQNGDMPVVGDYDGDGKYDIGIYRNGVWYANQSTAGLAIYNFGLGSDVAIPRRYQP